jgi:CBS domain-containing protein
MTVNEIMKKDVATCTISDDLAAACAIMRERKCGFVPVIDHRGIVVGVVTDRDVCLYLAGATTRSVEHLAVKDVMSTPVFGCFPDENLKVVLATMANRRVRRLTVLDRHGRLQGVLSVDDIVQVPRHHGAPTAEEIVDALKLIGCPPVETAISHA